MLIQLDFENDLPIYRQIRDQIVRGIADGQLAAGERLPSVRALADEYDDRQQSISIAEIGRLYHHGAAKRRLCSHACPGKAASTYARGTGTRHL